MITVKSLSKKFASFEAVSDVSFSVKRGEVLGIIGANGAGKSTIMRMIAGVVVPDTGSVFVNGASITTDPVVAKRGMGYLAEGAPLYSDMTPHQLLVFAMRLYRLSRHEALPGLLRLREILELDEVLDIPVKNLSKGYQRRVALACMLIHNPSVWVMDEPTDGLDPNQKHQMRTLILRMAAEKTVLLSTHILEEVVTLCSHIAILDKGRLVTVGLPHEMLSQSRYHGAVTFVMKEKTFSTARPQLESLPGVRYCETVRKGANTQVTLVVSHNAASQHVFESVQRYGENHNWNLMGIVQEPGRLQDVFATLTGGDVADGEDGGQAPVGYTGL